MLTPYNQRPQCSLLPARRWICTSPASGAYQHHHLERQYRCWRSRAPERRKGHASPHLCSQLLDQPPDRGQGPCLRAGACRAELGSCGWEHAFFRGGTHVATGELHHRSTLLTLTLPPASTRATTRPTLCAASSAPRCVCAPAFQPRKSTLRGVHSSPALGPAPVSCAQGEADLALTELVAKADSA